MKKKKHIISRVLPGSIGEELELEPGDRVLTINGNPVEDIFDYEYYVNSPSMTIDRKSTRLNSSHSRASRMPSSA